MLFLRVTRNGVIPKQSFKKIKKIKCHWRKKKICTDKQNRGLVGWRMEGGVIEKMCLMDSSRDTNLLVGLKHPDVPDYFLISASTPSRLPAPLEVFSPSPVLVTVRYKVFTELLHHVGRLLWSGRFFIDRHYNGFLRLDAVETRLVLLGSQNPVSSRQKDVSGAG